MPRRDVTLTDKIALLKKIKNQPPNPSHHQLKEITGAPNLQLQVLYRSKRNCEMNRHYVTDNRQLPKN
jgi:hypothetical protein